MTYSENKIIPKRIALRTQRGVNIFDINNIMYCSSEGRYTFIHLNDGKQIVTAKLLKSIQMALPDALFCRIHKSYLVNINYVKEFNILNNKTLILNNNEELKVSCRKQPEFFEKLNASMSLV